MVTMVWGQDTLPYHLSDTPNTRLVYEAAFTASSELVGVEYDWDSPDLAHCSGFTSRYLSNLGFPVGWVTGSVSQYQPVESDPIALSGTVYQATRLDFLNQQLGGGFTVTVDVETLIHDWNDYVPTGALVYWETDVNHNGYDAISHVAINLGYTDAGSPVLADFAAGMTNGPILGRSVEDVARGIYGDELDLTPSGDLPLQAYIYDVIGMMDQIGEHWAAYFPLSESYETPDPYVMIDYSPIDGFSEEQQAGGAYMLNSETIFGLNPVLAITVNLNDGTTTLWENGTTQIPVDSEGHLEAYSVIGRLLKVNPDLTQMYADSEWSTDGSRYDGEWGVLFDENGFPRTTYTPLMIGALNGFGQVDNFGLIGGSTNIAFLNTFVYSDGVLSTYDTHSHYTIHRVPQDTPDQDVLLREPDLIAANSDAAFGPLTYPSLNRSSGCINFDASTWIGLKEIIQPYIEQGLVVVVFAIPGIDQDLIIRDSAAMVADPLSNYTLNHSDWGYEAATDQRGYYTPLATENSA
jgi:hypothetical protein